MIFKAGYRGSHIEFLYFTKKAPHHRLKNPHNILFIHKGHLKVHLGEFGLAIRPEVFISKAPHNLIIAVKSGNHEKLLK